MINTIYQNILKEQDVRKNLIALRKEMKEGENQSVFLELLGENYDVLYKCLQSEDAKTRKNGALILGELMIPRAMELLWDAYQKEEKLFVKSDYLVAIRNFDYSPLLDQLKDRLQELTSVTHEETSLKHINEEIRTLTEMLLDMEKPSTHKFVGYNEQSEMILLTNREHQEVTMNQIHKGSCEKLNVGVNVNTSNLKEILEIRTYSDLLFRLPEVTRVAMTPDVAAKEIYEGGLLDFLKVRHEGDTPYYFRIEMKTKMALDKKSTFTKKMASELERLSGRELINSTSSYEVEIRLVENINGFFNVLIKLYTIQDTRFQYRENVVAASIQPVNAALIASLAKEHLIENALVLDPFCGVATMLLERNKVVPAGIMYGVDIFGEAIDKAIENIDLDYTDVYLINRDFFDFTHKHLFDEIFTNMPARMGRKTEDEIADLYNRFFNKAVKMLKNGGIIVMYTRDAELVEECVADREAYTILKSCEISKKEKAFVYVLSVTNGNESV